MKPSKILFFATIILLLFLGNMAYALQLEVEGLDDGVRQGEVALIRISPSERLKHLSGEFLGKEVLFEQDEPGVYTAMLGLGLGIGEGEQELLIMGRSEMSAVTFVVFFDVHKREYKVERLSLPKRMVTPEKLDLERIRREKQALKRVREQVTGFRFWAGDFIKPVEGKASNNFGARRVLNGKKKRPHSGTDLKAYAGTEIKSPNSGTVTYLDDTYYGGKTVAVDHGHGLSTYYMHLSKILVEDGEQVEKREVLGLVGSTGRSTGPHLHWGAYLNGDIIDPLSLLSLEIDRPVEQAALKGTSTEPLGGN